MSIIHLTNEAFDKAVSNGISMVDFWASWCGPCKMLAPVMEDLAGKYEGKALVGKVNVDDEPNLAMRFGVMSIPTVIFLKDGKEFDRKVGVMPPQAYTAVLDAGQWEGRQYVLPLGFSVPLMTSAADVLYASSFDLQRAMHTMDSLLSELLRIREEQPILVIIGIDPLGVLAQPVLDYAAHEVQLDTPAARRALELEKMLRTGDIAYDLARGLFDDADPAQVRDGFAEGAPFAVLQDSKFSINLLRQCRALGVEASVLPIPNEEGTVTAEIGSYAMGSRNTEHPEEVADLLLYLVGEECQSAAAYADCDSFPIRKGCMQACFDAQYQFSVRDASREKLTEEEVAERQGRYGAPLDAARIGQFETICDQVTAAHYQTIWYRGVDLGQTETGENVASFLHVQYWNDEITLDELIEILSSKMRLYLDE